MDATPGINSDVLEGRIRLVLLIVTGSKGIPRSIAILNAPFLKVRNCPSLLRDPSGKKRTDVPPLIFSLAALIGLMGWLLGGVLLPGLVLVAAGLVVGILQWLILRQRLAQAGWWILASGLGWTAGWGILITLIPPEYSFITGPVLGAAMGALQWLFLRLSSTRRVGGSWLARWPGLWHCRASWASS